MQFALQVFEYEDHREFRTLDIDGEPWFVLADVCRALELQDKGGYYGHHAERLDPDEKRQVARSVIDAGTPTLAGEGLSAPVGASLLCIKESGLYSLILTSKKPGAKRFKKWVTSEVLPSIRRTGAYRTPGAMPAFVRRFNENWDRVTPGFFSVMNELTVRLYGRLEMIGYVMADRGVNGQEMRPDVSVGRVFSDWLKKHHPRQADTFTYYIHKTPEWEGQVRQYPMDLLHLYIECVETVWIPEHGPKYFKARDPKALPYLPRLLPMAHKGRPGGMRGLPAPKWG